MGATHLRSRRGADVLVRTGGRSRPARASAETAAVDRPRHPRSRRRPTARSRWGWRISSISTRPRAGRSHQGQSCAGDHQAGGRGDPFIQRAWRCGASWISTGAFDDLVSAAKACLGVAYLQPKKFRPDLPARSAISPGRLAQKSVSWRWRPPTDRPIRGGIGRHQGCLLHQSDVFRGAPGRSGRRF